MRLLLPTGLLLLGQITAASAQTAPRTAFPGGFAPGGAVCVGQPDQSCQVVTATNPLPVASANAPVRDANGDLRVPTVTVTPFYIALAANSSTELLAPATARIGYELQCTGSAAVAISRTHAALSSTAPGTGGADMVIPAGSSPAYIPAYVSGLGVTAYTGTAQACWGVSYARQ